MAGNWSFLITQHVFLIKHNTKNTTNKNPKTKGNIDIVLNTVKFAYSEPAYEDYPVTRS